MPNPPNTFERILLGLAVISSVLLFGTGIYFTWFF